MSRHRDVRCMNYSDAEIAEYDGYDDVYGHSVEDDYCVSPSAEQFLFDRSKQQNIASFIMEPDIVEDNEDDSTVSSSASKKLDLSELERAKLLSCIETIKNVIGDSIAESKLEEEIIQSGFDTEVALDKLLKTAPQKSITEQSKSSKECLNPCPAEMIASHSDSKKLASCNSKQHFGSLADLTANHLQKSNISNNKIELCTKSSPNSGFIIPKLNINKDKKNFEHGIVSLKVGKENNADSTVNITSNETEDQFNRDKIQIDSLRKGISNFKLASNPNDEFTEQKSVNLANLMEHNAERVRTPSPDDWLIDLSAALKEIHIPDSKHNRQVEPMTNLYYDTLSYIDKMKNNSLNDSNSEANVECTLNLNSLIHIRLPYTKKTVSTLGKVLTRKWKLKKPFIKCNKLSSKSTLQISTSSMVKVVPAGTSSIVKGFTVTGSENTGHLSPHIQTPRSQSPCSEQNSPSVKRKENMKQDKNIVSLETDSLRSQSPMSGHVTPDLDYKTKSIEDKRDVLRIYKDKRSNNKEQLHLVVVGHVDAGKSTLLGRLLCDLGQVPSRLIHKYQQESKKIGKQSFAYAWVLDETGEERERGITMDVGHSKFETDNKCITLLDAPGHKDFIPNMITGATQADVALLVVDATRGEFETGFDSGGQTREHALLLRSLGVSQLAVVVNKLDTVNWSKERFNEIVDKMSVFLKQAGYRETITFVPCSGLSGENVVMPPKTEGLSNWYTGPTLVNVIDNFKCPERPVNKPFRFSVNDIYKGTGSGFCVSGHVETGMVAVGDKILVLPQNEVAVVKGLQADDVSIVNAFAGDHISLTLSGIDQQNVGVGDIICNPQNPVPVTTCFQAHVVIFSIAVPITKGFPVIMHQQSLVQPGIITKLIAQLHKSTGDVIKKKPRCLPKNSSAIIEIITQTPVCMELYKDVKQLGRIMLRVEGTTIAAGLITKIK
ncbi:HBS1-like protein [Vespula maculifrons]|uniref:HBS1-like protein n=1 Tax=Vespula maculifrons TaxID=7453 RepID=A0ABD2B6J0_VESMC